MNIKEMTLALVSVLTLASAPADSIAQQTRLLTADRHNEYGLVYSLPLTALRIEVTARHTVSKAGPFHQYAKKFIATDRVISSDSEKWEITSVSVSPFGIKDSSTQYLMQLKPGATTYIGVAEDGMLLSVNCRPRLPETSSRVAPAPVVQQFADNEYLQYVNEDFIASQSTVKQAQMLAESLMEIRDAKVSLTRGTADAMPTDGRQLELMLNSLAHQEGALTAAFTGTVTEEIVYRTFTFVPEQEGRSVLFRISDFAGFVDADDYSGSPVYADVRITNEATLPVDSKGEEKKLPKDAVMYNLPGSAEIILTSMGKTLYEGEHEFAQFGVRFGLNPTLFTDRKQPSCAEFDPSTGALISISAAEPAE